MSYDTRLVGYLAQGLAAARPAAPNAATDTLSFYFATDTETLSFYDWNDAAWQDVATSGGLTAATTTEQLTGTSTTVASTPDSVAALWEQGSDIASAGTISIGEGGYFHITGTTTITDIDFATTKAGRAAKLVFDGALILTHNATTLILPTGANITTAAGDTCLVVSEGGDNVRVTDYMRKDGTALVASSSGAMVLLDTQTASGGATASLTLTPTGTYTHLVIIGFVRSQRAAQVADGLRMRYNGDTGSNYNSEVLIGAGTNALAQQFQAATSIQIGDIPAANATANYCGSIHITICGYMQTTFFKSANGTVAYSASTSAAASNAEASGSLWLSTAAITSVTLFALNANLVDGTSFSLYGVS